MSKSRSSVSAEGEASGLAPELDGALERFLADLKSEQVSKSTLDAYRRDLMRYLAAATQAVRDEVRVFHAATSGRNPLMNPVMFRYIRQHFDEHPMLGRDGKVPELKDWTFLF